MACLIVVCWLVSQLLDGRQLLVKVETLYIVNKPLLHGAGVRLHDVPVACSVCNLACLLLVWGSNMHAIYGKMHERSMACLRTCYGCLHHSRCRHYSSPVPTNAIKCLHNTIKSTAMSNHIWCQLHQPEFDMHATLCTCHSYCGCLFVLRQLFHLNQHLSQLLAVCLANRGFMTKMQKCQGCGASDSS